MLTCPKTPKKFFLTLKEQNDLYEICYDTHDVLTQYGIVHWAFEGTLLGSFRHKGLIPWDDDLDFGITVSERKKLLDIPDEVWAEHNLQLTKHWLGFKIFRRDGYEVPNTPDWPYKYPFVDIFVMGRYGKKWQYVRGKQAIWEGKAAEMWSKEYILNSELFPLKPHVFDFPGGHRTLPVPRQSRKYLDRLYKGWDKVAYTNLWNHREERAETKQCKYMMPAVLKAEKVFFKDWQKSRGKVRDNPNAVYFRKYVDHIYIINLAHRTDRRAHIRKQMKLLGVPTSQFTFVKATDRSWKSQQSALLELGFPETHLPERGISGPFRSKDRKRDARKISNFMNRREVVYRRIQSRNSAMKNKGLAELAVTLSHARIWHKTMLGSHKRVLVLEDDACLASTFPQSDFKYLLTRATREMPERKLVLLGYCYPRNTRILMQGKYNLLEQGHYYCMQSYIITPKIAEKMLQMVFPVVDPVDVLFSMTELMKYSITFKNPIFNQSPEEGAKSDIQLELDIEGEIDNPDAMKFGQCLRE